MAKTKHELEVATNQAASELDPSSPFMAGLKSMVWGNNPPFSQTTSRADAMDMFQAEMATPEGRAGLVRRWGQKQASDIEQELIKAGRLPGQSIPAPEEPPIAN